MTIQLDTTTKLDGVNLHLLNHNRDFDKSASELLNTMNLMQMFQMFIKKHDENIDIAWNSGVFPDDKILYNKPTDHFNLEHLDDDMVFSLPLNIATCQSKKRYLSDTDRTWLLGRCVTDEQIENHGLFSIKSIDDHTRRESLNVTPHPAIKGIPEKFEGICIPCKFLDKPLGTVNRITNALPIIKYTSSTPNTFLAEFGTPQKDVWFVEGVFDAMAFETAGKYCITPSSGYLSDVQLFFFYLLLNKRSEIETVHLCLDNDAIGVKNMYIIGELLEGVISKPINITYNVVVRYKDPSECLYETGNIETIKLDKSDLLSKYVELKKRSSEYSINDYYDNRNKQVLNKYHKH